MTAVTRTYGNSTVVVGERTLIMGILNVTPDSFYDGGRYNNLDSALSHAERLVTEGADILDIGGESTRPSSEAVSTEEELARVIPVIKEIKQHLNVTISIDSYKADVAQAAADVGADIVNDVGGLRFDKLMTSVVKRTGVGCVIMHNADTRDRMHAQTAHADVLQEVLADLRAKIQLAEEAGISKEKFIIDPGIGFAKSRRDDLIMHRRLAELKSLGLPILFCSSRKRFIGDVLGLGKDQRLEGTIASCVIAALHGASIIRVHDVNEVARAIKIADAVRAAV
jgi:dihydropteroate synthase